MKKLTLTSDLILASVIVLTTLSAHGMDKNHQPWHKTDHGRKVLRIAKEYKQNFDTDYSKFSPITLPQIYFYFADIFSKDIAKYIFSLQPGSSKIDEKIDCLGGTKARYKASDLQEHINKTLFYYGYCYTVEHLSRNLLRKNLSLCDINNYGGGTVLHDQCNNLHIQYYSFNAQKEMIKIYLQVAGNEGWKLLNTKDYLDQTALVTAVKYSAKKIQLFLDTAGTHLWPLLIAQPDWGTILHHAACHGRADIVKLLLDAAGDNWGILLTMQDIDGYTALHRAIGHGSTETIKFLLDTAGKNLWPLLITQTDSHATALHHAADYQVPKTIKLLLDAAGNRAPVLINIRDEYGKTALDLARSESKSIILQYLQKTDNDGKVELDIAPLKIKNGAKEVVKPRRKNSNKCLIS